MQQIVAFLVTGLLAGILAGLFGVGGGLVIVPCLVLLLGFGQQAAAGTSLVALLAPVGIGGVYAFYAAGKINSTHIKFGLLISLGMVFGTYFGSRIAVVMSPVTLKRAFCVFLVVTAAKMWMTTTQ
ncbi:MAG: TSUP family transporter [Oligoflexia bacterium]|nr:TSUP family transporter [Oligoflexia bacterium]